MRNALRWPERATVSEWVDRNIVLGDDSAEPGPYHTDRTPYVREWQDSANLPWVHQVTIMKSTQVGGSVALLNVLAYAIAQDPGPITWVMPTREDAAEFGENRVQPMVDVSPTLRAQQTDERFDAKKRQIKFRRCRLLFRSARVPKELAQYPARWLFGDEAGKWPQWTQDEAAPFDLARERTRTFWNHKVYLNSTPTVPDGLISIEFERGDRRRYHVPCPHCRQFQVLRWKQVKWSKGIDTEADMRASRDAWYECEHCTGKIVDLHKAEMLARGWWCPEAVDPTPHIFDGRLILSNDRAAHRSYHLWAGYSPWLAWWEMAAEWLRSKQSPATLQNFINSWLGESWVEKVEDPKPEMLRECVGGYHRGEVPEGVRVITAGVDVQKRFLVFSVRGWGLEMESWLLDHGRVDDFDGLAAALFSRVWPRGIMLRAVFVDTNYRPSEVIDLARKFPAVVKLCKGVEFDDPLPFKAHSIERHPRTGAPIGALKAWHVNVGMFKDLVSASMRVGGIDGPGAFHVYEEADTTYLDEMTSEHKILQRTAVRERERWVKKAGHRQNHYWDTEVYNRAVAHLIRIDTMRGDGGTGGDRRPKGPPKPPNEPGGGRLWRRST
jgi:phage terminase large subunit GpA-like protein